MIFIFHQVKTDLRLHQNNPVQVLLCVIVLLDAGIVIAQILLDLNSVKGNFLHFSFLRSKLMRKANDG